MKLIISGSSTTNDKSWPTWATWIKKRYKFKNTIDLSVKGLGNEVILLKAIDAAKQTKNPFIIIQLTSVDKWDWYVQDTDLIKEIIEEKHPITKINQFDQNGFWSTGSHFPKWKQYYQENYFSLDYFAFRTLMSLHWFQLVCQQNNWPYYILFDSPVLSVTETQLNTGLLTDTECVDTKLVTNSLCGTILNLVDIKNIYTPGIVGYACLNNLPWYTKKYKGHPGSLIHFLFTRDIIDNHIRQIIQPVAEFKEFEFEAQKYQGLVDE